MTVTILFTRIYLHCRGAISSILYSLGNFILVWDYVVDGLLKFNVEQLNKYLNDDIDFFLHVSQWCQPSNWYYYFLFITYFCYILFLLECMKEPSRYDVPLVYPGRLTHPGQQSTLSLRRLAHPVTTMAKMSHTLVL